ncbi:MAG: hypothetical protein QOJ00_1934 [Actinomycetota bacterium]
MRRRLLAIVVAAVLTVAGGFVTSPSKASPAQDYTGTHFGAGNIPPGCERDSLTAYSNNACYHMRTDMNGLDSPQVDVLILVPVSPTAERDMRIMREAVQMWEGGVHNLAPQMGLNWLGQGMQFHITVDEVDPNSEFTTYPVVDPEIVVVATNPVGGAGIGIDPLTTISPIAGTSPEGPCTGIHNPFDFDAWNNLPGFDRHHKERMGTYVEDCGGAGGNICFAINGAIDPAPDLTEEFSMFDLVAHEFGHCLTIGHVGDGAEGPWGKVPTNDIMSYNTDPPGLNKCVSTLDVEGIATRMSRYLDVNADHKVDAKDRLYANDQAGDGKNPFQTQNPRDHLYASSTGAPTDCPQPDLGLVPGPRTNWEPGPVTTSDPVLNVTRPSDGASSPDGAFNVAGTVAHVARGAATSPVGYYDDSDNDAKTRYTEIKSFDVAVKPTTVEATIHLAALPPTGTKATSAVTYTVTIDARRFDSLVRYPKIDPAPMTFDAAASTYMPAGTSTWNTTFKTVTFHIPRSYLQSAGITAPYDVTSQSNLGTFSTFVTDDHAPEVGHSVGVSSARVVSTPVVGVSPREASETVTFHHPGGNTFHPEDSTLGVTSAADLGLDASHRFSLDVPKTSDVSFVLDWTDAVGGADLDLRVKGAADSGETGATKSKPETVALTNVRGHLEMVVEPFLSTDPQNGNTYTLTAVITPKQVVDTDGDGVPDSSDVCPNVAGDGADGCPIQAQEHVRVYVDGVKVATQGVDTSDGADSFAVPVTVAPGAHTLMIEWESYGRILATKTIHVSGA